jgi:hypothetical protein
VLRFDRRRRRAACSPLEKLAMALYRRACQADLPPCVMRQRCRPRPALSCLRLFASSAKS